MARPASSQPTERELDILQVLWRIGPASLSDIRQALPQQRAVTTVATMLKVMHEKRLVDRTDDRKWRAILSEQTARRKMVRRLIDGVFDGSARRMIAHVLENGRLNNAEIDELQNLLEQFRPDDES